MSGKTPIPKPRRDWIKFSDRLRKWHEFWGSISERSRAKQMQSPINFDTQLKIALFAKQVRWKKDMAFFLQS